MRGSDQTKGEGASCLCPKSREEWSISLVKTAMLIQWWVPVEMSNRRCAARRWCVWPPCVATMEETCVLGVRRHGRE